MLALQFSIGAANDLADAVPDAVAKPGKPLPAGDVPRIAAVLACLISAGLGLLAAASVGAGALVIGTVGLADGLIYDLKLKRTPIAWVPFAAGVGLLPLYAWWGARGSLPPLLIGVAGVAVLAGAALALANAYADIDADRRSGIASIAVLLGRARTLLVNGLLMACAQGVVLVTTMTAGAQTPLVLSAEVAGCGLGWLGLALAGNGGDRLRPLVWEVQAVGMLVLGSAWLVALNQAGALRG